MNRLYYLMIACLVGGLACSRQESAPVSPLDERYDAASRQPDDSSNSVDSLIGQKVFTRNDARARIGNSEVDISVVDRPATVEKVDGEWLWLGHAWVKRSDVMLPAEALQYYSEAIRKTPGLTNATCNRGNVWYVMGEYDKAIDDFNEAIRIDPRHRSAYNSRGAAWNHKGNYEQAIRDYTAVIKLDPQYVNAYNNRAKTLQALGRYDDAVHDLNEAIRIDPTDAVVFASRAALFIRKEMFDKAIQDCEHAIRLDPLYAKGFTCRGNAWICKGDYLKAIGDYQDAIRVNPIDPSAYRGLALLQACCPDAKYRNGENAIASATKGCELSSWKSWEQVDTLAAAYAETGDFENALKWERKAQSMATNEAQKTASRERLELFGDEKPFRFPAKL